MKSKLMEFLRRWKELYVSSTLQQNEQVKDIEALKLLDSLYREWDTLRPDYIEKTEWEKILLKLRDNTREMSNCEMSISIDKKRIEAIDRSIARSEKSIAMCIDKENKQINELMECIKIENK